MLPPIDFHFLAISNKLTVIRFELEGIYYKHKGLLKAIKALLVKAVFCRNGARKEMRRITFVDIELNVLLNLSQQQRVTSQSKELIV